MGVFLMININNAVQFQHLLWDRIMKQAKIVVDATCGNGHDLLYLVERAKPNCHVYGIDIQERAIQASQSLLEQKKIDSNITITFLHNSHDKAFAEDIQENSIDLIIFNLGYLPGGNHTIVTKPYNTMQALQLAMPKLVKDGVITIVAYPGTLEGYEEMKQLEYYLSSLNQKLYNVCHWKPINQVNNPPQLYIIQKR